MGRPKGPFSDSPKTTWSVSQKIDDRLRDFQHSRETKDECLKRLFDLVLGKKNDEQTPENLENTLERYKASIDIYRNELRNLVDRIEHDPTLKETCSYDYVRLKILLTGGPQALVDMDDEIANTGRGYEELAEKYLILIQ